MATENLLELFERIRNNDYQAFEQVFESQWRELYRYAYKVLRHAADAEDLTQELFCDLWANRTQLRVHSNAPGYLVGALRKKILTRFRDATIRSRHLQAVGAAQPHSTETTFARLVGHDTLAAIQARAQGLPPKEKEVFLLGMLGDFSVKEIAEKFATSEQTVRNQLNSALHKMSPFLTKLLS
ncbi:RNA polymerase sigma factor [Hymenobacter cellulosilyticus]|uniref:Sigma-70 family RNA polymerase sigma factor n=1 Tax=Hymenobacter cellulosilyticus TaxID=2932248 RepID=A0A8T9Q3M4_9BACT|nr:sigma-70 family RNA polymerase sigma factor [Hymenobacter cellulosilyticus]UOQ71572.1 sigma-70 family RNA polymerase sigma factor [Hymenobacter cellulosilyticus]